MLYEKLRLFIPVKSIFLPKKLKDKRNIVFVILPENDKFFDFYNLLGFRKTVIRTIYVPRTTKPVVTKLDSKMRQKIRDYRLIPISGKLQEDYIDLFGKNFFLDPTVFLDKVIEKYKLRNFFKGRGLNIINSIINSVGSIPKTHFERVILYSLNLNKYIPKKLLYKKFLPLFIMLMKWEKKKIDIPFDKIILFVYNEEEQRFLLIFDRNQKVNLARIKKILNNVIHIKNQEIENKEKELEIEEKIKSSDIANEFDEKEKDKLVKIVANYADKENIDIKKTKPNMLLLTSGLYHITGSLDKAIGLAIKADALPTEKKISFLRKFSKHLLNQNNNTISESNDILIKNANPSTLIDNQIPKHLIGLRKSEFTTNLKTDMVNLFKTLENEPLPLKFKDIKVEELKETPGEIEETLLERYTITLEDEENKEHIVNIDFPKLTENGTFIINGKPKVLVNQIVTHPIFFIKPYSARFESSYSSFSIISKQLKTRSYLIAFFANYKVPLFMLLAYKVGFEETLKLFGIKYEITDKKTKDSYKLNNGKYIIFKTVNTVQEELIESFAKSMHYFPKDQDINSEDFWRETLVNYNGNRNSIYAIDQTWKNIVTPIEKSILSNNNEPVDLPNIMKYMSNRVCSGFSYDRNDIRHSRIRSSEILISQLQKQIKAAYNEYLSKVLGGDKNANYFIDSRKVLTDIKTSQNVQNFESINPLEELSFLTRITPVGIGGIPNLDAMPEVARNIHPSYFGNIDPLESPEGPSIGIQQHLTVGASIVNNRGMFGIKIDDKIKPSEILSTTSAMIPFVEYNEGARINMATGQAKQAFPLLNPENPAVQSGYESILTGLLSDNFIKKSPVNGKVVDLTDEIISIKDQETGKIINIDITPRILRSGQGKNGLSIFKPKVTINTIVKKDQIVAEGANIKDGLISNGINLLVAFMPWKGYNFEDGQVISKSAAKKFVSLHNEEYKIYLTEEEDVSQIAKVGQELSPGEILIAFSTTIYDVESLNIKRCEGGRLVRIEIYNNLPKDKEIPKLLEEPYKEFVKHYEKLHGRYPRGKFKEQGRQFKGIMLKFILKQELELKKGDKINNRFFNKGLIAIIEEDENMPITPWGERIDLIYNPISIINRMNPGQLMEMHTGLISRKLAQLIETSPRKKFESTFGEVLKILDKTKDKTYSKNVISALKKLGDKEYERLKEYYKQKRFIPIISPPFKGPKKDDILKALSFLNLKPTYKLKLPEFNKYTDDEIGIGYIYVFKLEHLSEKKLHARSTGPYVAKTLAPTGGKKRGGGASLGELDLYSLLAYDTKYLIDEFYGPLSNDHKAKNNMISEIVRTGETSFQTSLEDPVREMFVQYMTAIHLISD